jgi:hypothetical protein
VPDNDHTQPGSCRPLLQIVDGAFNCAFKTLDANSATFLTMELAANKNAYAVAYWF